MFNNIKATLKPFQVDVVKYCLRHHYVVNASDMGTGKSIEALTVHQEVGGACLIVCPAYLRGNWRDEYEKFCIKVPEIQELKTTKQILACDNFEVAIISYAGITHAAHLFKKAKVIIVDESQHLKNPNSQRTQAFTSNISAKPPHRLMMLSGTPIKNRVDEFYTQLNLTKYNPFGTYGMRFGFSSYYAFAAYFCPSTKYEVSVATITKYFGLKKEKLPTLKRMMVGKYIRVRAHDVLTDLPDLLHKEVTLDVQGGHARRGVERVREETSGA